MRTQDVKYIEMKRVAEAKVIIGTLCSVVFLLFKKNANSLVSNYKLISSGIYRLKVLLDGDNDLEV